jgi:hypothetical protein
MRINIIRRHRGRAAVIPGSSRIIISVACSRGRGRRGSASTATERGKRRAGAVGAWVLPMPDGSTRRRYRSLHPGPLPPPA